VKASLHSPAAISSDLRAAMLGLLGDHFEGVSAAGFWRDLADKSRIVMLHDEGGALRGFSTLRYERTQHEGRPIAVIHSGDTIVDRTARPSTALFRCWIQSVLQLHGSAGSTPLYWLLIVSGYRTYRLLPVFWQAFFPVWHRPTPSPIQSFMNNLATRRYGEHYDRRLGIVRLDEPQVLREPWRSIPPARLSDPHVAFFARRNAGYARGDELLCLTELSPRNLTPAGRRMLASGPAREEAS
jgi:hypothetical protein